MAATPADQSSAVSAALREIVFEHGPEALSNPAVMSNLLKDFLPDSPAPARMLVAAAEDHIADVLRQHVAEGLDPVTAARLAAAAFANATMFSPEACAWVVGELGMALGLLEFRSEPAGLRSEYAAAAARSRAAPPTAPAGGYWQQPAPGTQSVPFSQPTHGHQMPGQPLGQQPQGQQPQGQQPQGQPGPAQPGRGKGRAAAAKPAQAQEAACPASLWRGVRSRRRRHRGGRSLRFTRPERPGRQSQRRIERIERQRHSWRHDSRVVVAHREHRPSSSP